MNIKKIKDLKNNYFLNLISMYDKTLEVHVYEITVNSEDALNEQDERQDEIQLWCFDKNSFPMLLRVRDFPVFCKIQLPALVAKNGFVGKWNQDLCDDLIKFYRLTKDEIKLILQGNWGFKIPENMKKDSFTVSGWENI